MGRASCAHNPIVTFSTDNEIVKVTDVKLSLRNISFPATEITVVDDRGTITGRFAYWQRFTGARLRYCIGLYVSTIRVLRPGSSQQNKQCIWRSLLRGLQDVFGLVKDLFSVHHPPILPQYSCNHCPLHHAILLTSHAQSQSTCLQTLPLWTHEYTRFLCGIA
jgi:hypothetical protein